MEIPEKSLYLRKWNFLILQETELYYSSRNGIIVYFGKTLLELEAYLYLEIKAYL